MELTFRDYEIAYKLALKLVEFGRVRIERCYRFREKLEVIYKLYLDCLCIEDEIFEIIQNYSNKYEESFEDVRRILIEKDKILREILDSLSIKDRTFDELREDLNGRGVDVDDLTLRALINELEENGYVVEDDRIRLSKPL